jgi:zinc protease
MGWGVLDYFVEQPGRFSLTEAFLANNHALIHRLNDPATPKGDLRGLAFDRDVVAFYGDPKWEAKMAEMPKYYDQTLEIKDGVYTLTIKPNRGKDSFKPVNTNGSQRGWRPVIQFLPHRVKDVEFQAGEDLKPTVTDDFILIPNPRECDPQRQYIVRFNAKRK